MLEAALDAAGLDRAVIGLGDADLYRQLLTEFGVEGEARDSILGRLATHDLVGARGRALRRSRDRRRAGADLRRALAAARRQRGAGRRRAASAAPRSSGRPPGCSETYEELERARRRRPGPDRPRPAARPRLLQRRDPRGLRPGARPRARRRRPLRRPDEALRRSTCRRPASPSTWSASTSPRWRSRGGGGRDERRGRRLSRAKADGPLKLAVPRGALFGETLDVLDAAGVDTAELRGDSRSLIFETDGDDPGDDAALRRADLRRGRRRRRRHHRQGRAARAGRPGRLRAARPRLRPLPHGARRPHAATTAWARPSGGWG